MIVRYRIRHVHGRYEIQDALIDQVICYSYVSEYAQQIANAMNKIWKEIETDRVVGEIGG